VSGVLSLAERSVRSIMTPRGDISWADIDADPQALRDQLLATPHSLFPVCRGSLDAVVGVARVKDLLGAATLQARLEADAAYMRTPLYLPANTSVMQAIDILRHARGQLALVTDEYGQVQGVVTPIDVLEAIAGEFPDEDETLEIQAQGDGQWRVAGSADLHQLERVLDTQGLVSDDDRYTSVAGYLLAHFGRLPTPEETVTHDGFEFRVLEVDEQRIRTVQVSRMALLAYDPAAGPQG
ncbi:MAG: HlyC/CorC family transporter, partial [Comamonadaceae bacterium]